MNLKRGQIVGVLRTGNKFVRMALSTGAVVEIPIPLVEIMIEKYPKDQDLLFVEQKGRLFTYVQWVGTEEEYETELVRLQDPARSYPVEARPREDARSSGVLARLISYAVVTGAIYLGLSALHVSELILYGYLLIAAIGFVMAMADLARGR